MITTTVTTIVMVIVIIIMILTRVIKMTKTMVMVLFSPLLPPSGFNLCRFCKLAKFAISSIYYPPFVHIYTCIDEL